MADGGWRNVPCPAIPIHPLRGGELQQPEGLGSLKTPRWTTRKKETKRERKRERVEKNAPSRAAHLLTYAALHPRSPSSSSSSPIFSVRPSLFRPVSFLSFPSLLFLLSFFPLSVSPPREGKMKSLAGVIHDAQDASMRPFDSRHSYNSVAPVK